MNILVAESRAVEDISQILQPDKAGYLGKNTSMIGTFLDIFTLTLNILSGNGSALERGWI